MTGFTQTVGNRFWRLRFGEVSASLPPDTVERSGFKKVPMNGFLMRSMEVYLQSGLPVRGYALVGVKE